MKLLLILALIGWPAAFFVLVAFLRGAFAGRENEEIEDLRDV